MCKFLAIETQLPGPTVCMREEQEGEGEGGGACMPVCIGQFNFRYN